MNSTRVVQSPAVALSIAGSDPSGGAGIQADLKTFHQHGLYGTSVITLLTVQNTQCVDAVKILEPEFVLAQLEAVLCDIPPAAAKTGALGSAEIVAAVAHRAATFRFPLVVDPVCVSKHGVALLDAAAIEMMKSRLIPIACLVTPNLAEAALLTGINVFDRHSMADAARRIAGLGAANVLIKGGHLQGDPVDILFADGRLHDFRADRVESKNTHGGGCVFSAAITAHIAKGETLHDAISKAKAFITEAIRSAPELGGGYGPVNLHTVS